MNVVFEGKQFPHFLMKHIHWMTQDKNFNQALIMF